MNRAVFLDRDGVINKLILNPQTGKYESPLSESDLKIEPEVFFDLKKLKNAGFLLFVVSNQPNYAKGKATLEFLHRIEQLVAQQMNDHGIDFSEYYYCYHHPKGIVSGYSGECLCRKPKPYFLLEAQKKYGIDMKQSWMVGDQETDIQCGQAAGVRTIRINTEHGVPNLTEAVKIILER